MDDEKLGVTSGVKQKMKIFSVVFQRLPHIYIYLYI